MSNTDGEWDYLKGNAYHEAIVGWALGLHVNSITIRDDRPGENAKISSADALPLVDQIALSNAGRQPEEVFARLLPAWASNCDRVRTVNLLLANDFAKHQKWNNGSLTVKLARESY